MSLSTTLKLSRRALLGLALVSGLAGALMSAALTFGLEAWANHDNNPATDGVPRAFSYNGSLEWDGVALNGPVEMTFKLFGTSDAPPEAALWSETQRLTAYSGKFGAELGADPLNPVTDTLYDAGPLWLGVSVQRLDEGGAPVGQPITLDNKQKINPVPYALWSTQSSNLNVAGNATVGGLTTTDGLLVGGRAESGSLSVVGNTQTGSLGVMGQTQTASLSVAGHTQTNSLGVTGNTTLSGNAGVSGRLEVSGPLNLLGGVSSNLLREVSSGTVSANSSDANGFVVVQATNLGRSNAVCVWHTTRTTSAGGCAFERYADQWRALAFGRATCEYTCYTWLPATP